MAGPVLVTGAAGFVGGHLLEALVAEHATVIGWYRPATPTPPLRPDVRWAAVELLDAEAVKRTLSEHTPSAIYHLAGAAHVAQSWQFTLETYESNVLATHHLLRAAEALSPRPRVLVTCSGTIYRAQERPLRETDAVAPASPYATSKLAQEMVTLHAWHADGVPAFVARAFNHTGPGQDPAFVAPGIAQQIARIEAGLQEPVLRVGNLEPRRDLTDVRDVARAYVAMMARAQPGTVYNVCSGRQLSIGSLVETFVSRARVDIQVVQDATLFRPNDTPLLVGDHARLTADTGWTPRIPLEQTVNELLDYWRQRVRR